MAKTAAEHRREAKRKRGAAKAAAAPAPPPLDLKLPSTGEEHDPSAERAQHIALEAARVGDEAAAGPFPRVETRDTRIRKGMVGVPRGNPQGAAAVASAAGMQEGDFQLPEAIRQAFTMPPPIHKSSPAERVFKCRVSGMYVLQMTCPVPRVDQFGRPIDEPGRALVFREHYFRTDDPEEIEYIETAKGYGTSFWDAELEQRFQSKQAVAAFKEALVASQETLEVLRSELSSDDFNVVEALSNKTQREKRQHASG